VRLRRSDIRQRVNGSLTIRFQAEGLTSYAGLELLGRYFSWIRLNSLIRNRLPGGDYSATSMVRLLITLIIVGGRRLRHTLYLQGDPLVERLCGLKCLPDASTISRWLMRFGEAEVETLAAINEEVTSRGIVASGVKRLTIDVDGSVISTGLKVQGARRGFNPHHRKSPSYYPISAYEAQTGQMLRVRNRPGNVHDGKASLDFLKDVFQPVRGLASHLEFRMDGAFCRDDVLDLLGSEQAEYAIKMPFWDWLGLKELVAARQRWRRMDREMGYFETELYAKPWDRSLRVVVFRKRVAHQTRKNFQIDMFDPDDGHYEYSAIVTNKRVGAKSLWEFMAGRGSHEKAYGELKSGFAFACVPTQYYGANSAWQQISILSFNLIRGFQAACTSQRRTASRKRRTLFEFETIQTLRFRLLHRAGLVNRPNGRTTLDVGTNPEVAKSYTEIAENLAWAA